MDTTTTAQTPPARKPRKIAAPRAGSITAYIIAALAQQEAATMSMTSRDIIRRIAEREGRDVPLRIMSATLAILRFRGNVMSHPQPGAEHGQMLYGLTERGRTLAALMTTPAAAALDA